MAEHHSTVAETSTIPTPQQAKHSGKYAVQATSDDRQGPPPLVSPLYDTEEEASAALPQLLASHPCACVVHWPTREKWGASRQEAENEFVLVGYYIYADLERAGVRRQETLEGPYGTKDEVLARLAALKSDHPSAYAAEVRQSRDLVRAGSRTGLP